MAWEWIVLVALTIIGPAMFHRFIPVRQEVIVRGGAVFTVEYGPVAQIMRSAAKFGFVWLIALGLAQLESRLWLRLWIIGLPVIGQVGPTKPSVPKTSSEYSAPSGRRNWMCRLAGSWPSLL